MLKLSDTAIEPVTQRLGSHGLRPVYLVPTPTGLQKFIMDATKPVQAFLCDVGLHDYSQQPQGPEHKVHIEATFIHADGITDTSASLYRPISKKGDPRIWFTGLPRYATAGNLLVLVHVAGTLAIINASNSGILDSIDEATSPLANLARQASVGRSLRVGYAGDSGTAPTVLAIGTTEKGRESTRMNDQTQDVTNAPTVETDTWTIKDLNGLHDDGHLKLDPEWQRREVWQEKDEILLIDSIARGMPIGALTLFKVKTNPDVHDFYVIDGKQRLTSILRRYMVGKHKSQKKFVVKPAVVEKANRDDEDFYGGNIGDRRELVEAVERVSYPDLKDTHKKSFNNFRIPVFLISGAPTAAIGAFRRMNATNFALTPMEITQAAYNQSAFLRAIESLTKALNEKHTTGEEDLLVQLEVQTEKQQARMKDIQFYAEVLLLILEGKANHRRDGLVEKTFSRYNTSLSADDERTLDTAQKRLVKVIGQILETLDLASKEADEKSRSWRMGDSMKAAGFTRGEHDLYALIGAFASEEEGMRELSNKDIKERGAAIGRELIEFGRQVTLFDALDRQSLKQMQQEVISNSDPDENQEIDGEMPDETVGVVGQATNQLTATDQLKQTGFPSNVKTYVMDFRGGQTNSANRRKARIHVLRQIIVDLLGAEPGGRFTEQQRNAVWASTLDKSCARCEKPVTWKDFQAGHKTARRKGGKAYLENSQIEHGRCNSRAQDRDG